LAGTTGSDLEGLGNAAPVDRILALLERTSMSLAKCLAAAILAILAAQVFFRFALNQSLIWSEEVAAWCMVWLVYLGAAALVYRGEHVSIPFFLNLLPGPLRRLGAICRSLAMLLGVLFITVYGIKLVFGTFHIVSQATGINSRWVKLCIPISGALMTLFALRLLVSDIRAAIAGDPGAEASGNDGSGKAV
jgi:TRAP-type C4-dicarboxylate transport system permease small subunit